MFLQCCYPRIEVMVDWRQIRVSHSPITASLFHSKMYIQKNSLLDPSELLDKFVSRRIKKNRVYVE